MSAIMSPMRYIELLGWGVVIYAVMFLLWAAFVTHGFVEGIAPRIVALFVLLTMSAVAAQTLRTTSWQGILPYSFTWGAMMVLLDALMSVPVYGWEVYANPAVWIGYGLVVVVPLFSPRLFAR